MNIAIIGFAPAIKIQFAEAINEFELVSTLDFLEIPRAINEKWS